MKLQNECNKGVRISYSCTNIYGKYAWVNPLKKQEGCDDFSLQLKFRWGNYTVD